VSLELGGDGIRERSGRAANDRAPAGARSGGVVAQRVTVVADVLAINTRTQTLTLRGPEHTMDVRVPDPKQLKLVKVGDQVVATFTEAVAVSVEHATTAAPAKK
jgi:Cu/Ag efflux protein CusF